MAGLCEGGNEPSGSLKASNDEASAQRCEKYCAAGMQPAVRFKCSRKALNWNINNQAHWHMQQPGLRRHMEDLDPRLHVSFCIDFEEFEARGTE
ncbi:hypothetical protein ANN_15510 [Periplaneta americana]|uniref:Uncharacterized protein n=1 Tax=Periplaneta americana TaxID=6978 RepID=A0ABQ8SHT0_PERAM|nr:hypothetical protein ANN_15510 [Periplaneta americana]